MNAFLTYLVNNKVRVLTVAVILSFLGVGVYLALNQTVFKSRATLSKATFRIQSDRDEAAAGQNVLIETRLAINGKKIVALDSEVEYDPRVFEVADSNIEAGDFFTFSGRNYGFNPIKRVENGKIKFSWVAFDPANRTPINSLLWLQDQFGGRGGTSFQIVKTTLRVKSDAPRGETVVRFGPAASNIAGVPGETGNQGEVDSAQNLVRITVTGGGGLSCVLSASDNSFPVDSRVDLTLTVSGGSVPSGSKVYHRGFNGSTAIQEGLAGNFTSSPFTQSFTGSQFGGVNTYKRTAVVKDANNNVLCTSNEVTLDVRPSGSSNLPACDIAFNPATFRSDQSTTMTITSSNLPTNAKAFVIGKNGSQDIPEDEYTGFVPNQSYTRQYSGSLFGGAGSYTRGVVIKAGHIELCRKAPVNITIQPAGGSQASCSQTIAPTSAGPNDNIVFTFQTSNLPSDAKAYAFGKNRGQNIGEGEYSRFTPNSQSQQTFRGSDFGPAGEYTRGLVVRNSSGAELCRVAETTIQIRSPQGLSCVLSASDNSFPVDSRVDLTLTVSGGSVPSGSKVYHRGFNGSTAIQEGLAGNFTSSPFTQSYTGSQFGGVNTYKRTAIVKDANNNVLCTSNEVVLDVRAAGAQTACNLTITPTTLGLFENSVSLITSANLPALSRAFAEGTNNGSAIQRGAFDNFTPNQNYQANFTGLQFGGKGTYTRKVVITDSSGNDVLCNQQNPVTVNVAAKPSDAALFLSRLGQSVDRGTMGDANRDGRVDIKDWAVIYGSR